MNQSRFDYVIVGAGSAGCVVANKLSEDPRINVLLLEAGGPDRNPLLSIPKGIAFTLSNPKYTWFHDTEPFGPFDQTEYWLRGKVVGGSSSVNGMVYNRGSQPDYDAIEAAGNPGWGWNELLRVFRSMEDHSLGSSAMRGAGGPLKVGVRTDHDRIDDALIASAGGLGINATDDINSSDEERIGYTPATIHKGVRVSTSNAFLKPAMGRENLTVRTGITVTGLAFEGNTVVGVDGRDRSGAVSFSATREVILSAGSIATPHLLQLSGIGSAEVLKSAGIDVRVDSPNVGENVREHRCFPLQARLSKNLGYNRLLSTAARQGASGLRWLLTRSGPIGTPSYDMLGFLKTDDGLERPDAQILLAPFSMGLGGLLKTGIENRPGISLLGFALRPTSTGSIHVVSQDPSVPVRIQPNYLSTEEDRKTSIALFRKMRHIIEQSPIADLVSVETVPGQAVRDDESIINSGFLYGGTGYHSCGSVAMGPNEEDPLDSKLRVRGVDNLRVVDVSALPAMVSGNLNGPAMALGWRAAELILDDI